VNELPITPERVLRGVRKQKQDERMPNAKEVIRR
jgi:hypothetical protein